MVIHLANSDGKQLKAILDAELDVELNKDNRDFKLTVPLNCYDKRIWYGSRLFVENTEIGGIIGRMRTNTAVNAIEAYGYTWRGMLENKVIVPPDGQDHYAVSGELNTILRNLIEPVFDGIFLVPEFDTGVLISDYKFERFCTLRYGLEKMLKSAGYRLHISYNPGEPNGAGWVEVSAVPVTDYSSEIELSKDCRLNYIMDDIRNGVNHLIIGGKGDLQERNIIHLYVQSDGTIGKSKYYTGINEIERFYENTSTDSTDIEDKGEEELQKLMNRKMFEMNVEQLGIDVAIGDIVGGRDYITGNWMAKPVENIVIKIENGKMTKDYFLEGTS